MFAGFRWRGSRLTGNHLTAQTSSIGDGGNSVNYGSGFGLRVQAIRPVPWQPVAILLRYDDARLKGVFFEK
jgi:hypothetical protein